MSTYTICLDGRFYACGMDLLCSVVYSLETREQIDNIRTVTDRNAAIMALCSPLACRDAIKLARRSGNYSGQLYSYEKHITEV